MSPSLSQTSSPGQRTKSKRNFIKNIKPDTFKRPSSYSCTEAEIASAKNNKIVELVGYRKKVATPGASSRVGNSKFVELGTLSPLQSSTKLNLKLDSQVPDSLLASSVSMPTLFERSGWNRNSDSTLPAYREVARRSLRAKKRNAKSSIIHVDFGGSDPSLRSEESDHSGSRRRLKRAFTDPVRHSDNLELMLNSNESSHDVTLGKDHNVTTREVVSKTSGDRNLDIKSADLGKDSEKWEGEPEKTSGAKKELNFQQELYQNLSKCLTEALGDADELNDSDKSDDDSCIQNGYDVFLEKDLNQIEKASHAESERLNENLNANVGKTGETRDVKSETSAVKRISVSPEKVPSPSTPRKSGLTVTDVLRSSDLKVGPSGRTDLLSRQSTDSNSTVNTDSGIDVLSVSGVSVRDEQIDSSSLKSDVKIICDSTDFNTKSLHDRVTVSEFLREEYRKSSLVDISVQSENLGNLDKETNVDSDIESSEIMNTSVKNNFRASSESNLLQSTMLEVKRNGDVMVSSASFPELSKLSESVKEQPKLVDKVGHSTVR